MDVPETTADRADGSTSPEPAAPRPRATISATELPGPRMPAPMQARAYWKGPTAFMEQCRERYGSRFALRLRIPPRPLYVLTDPEDVRQMFMAPHDVIHTGRGSSVIEKFIGQTGLAWMDEDEHNVRRRHILPSLHGDALQRIETSTAEMAGREVATWPRGEVTALHPFIHRIALNVIGEVLFGSAPPRCWEELRDVLTGMMRFGYRMTSSLVIHNMPPAAVRLLTAIRALGLYDFLKLRERADALIDEVVQERRSSGALGDDMLALLLSITHDDGSPLSAVELRDEMMTMLLAGTETTASGLSWALEYLSREHAARERLVAEIDSGEGDDYLTATVHEVLRRRPPLPQLIVREVMKPIEIGGVRYEPGMLLWTCVHLVHHDPSTYPDPYAFRPERFLGTRPGTYTWIPFGGGRIRCLGDRIAIQEMKAVLREVLARYELRRVDPQPEAIRSRLVVIVPAKGVRLELRARSPEASLVGA
jgi:cytochrome P450 family 135